MIFDEARTRGSDIKMPNSVCAALTLGPNMTQFKFMQAMGRLRNIEAGQTIKIIGTNEIFSKIDEFERQIDLQKQLICILRWLIKNSGRENEKFLFHNNKLSWLHFKSKNMGMLPYIEKFIPEL